MVILLQSVIKNGNQIETPITDCKMYGFILFLVYPHSSFLPLTYLLIPFTYFSIPYPYYQLNTSCLYCYFIVMNYKPLKN